MDTRKLFVGALFLLIAGYIFIYVESSGAKWFGGGVLALLGAVTLISALRKKEVKKVE